MLLVLLLTAGHRKTSVNKIILQVKTTGCGGGRTQQTYVERVHVCPSVTFKHHPYGLLHVACRVQHGTHWLSFVSETLKRDFVKLRGRAGGPAADTQLCPRAGDVTAQS